MLRKGLFTLLCILCATITFSQNVKTLTLSPDFATVPGTPRAVFNSSKNIWVIVWHQGTAIRARTVTATGTLTAPKNLATGATTASQSFDLAFNTDDFSYLVAFENASGLQVRSVSSTLVPGATHSVEAGTKGGVARLVYDPVGKQYFIFWLGSQDGARSVLRVRTLDRSGYPLTNTVDLTSAGAGKTFDSLNLARNPKSGNMLAIVLQQTSAQGAVLKVNVTSAGKISGAPATFQALTTGLETIGSASFSTAGIGFGLWSDKSSIKRRKVASTGAFGSGVGSIANAADVNSKQVAINFSSSANQFAAAWAKGNQILFANLNSTSGAPIKSPSAIATSALNFSRDAYVSTDAQGNSLVAWEDSDADASAAANNNVNSAKFRIRAAIIPGSGSGGGGGGGTSNVSVQDDFFSPSSLTISAGTTVVWTWKGGNPHTVTSGTAGSPNGTFSSPQQTSGTFSFTFNQKGSFPYFCQVHGAAMTGTITVQ